MVGDAIADLKSDLSNFDKGVVALNPTKESWYRGYFNASGQLVSNNSNAAPMDAPILAPSGTILVVKPEGMRVQVQTYSYSDGVYTRITNNNYTTDVTIEFSEATYFAINVTKISGATLPLNEMVAELYYISNIQKQITSNSDKIDEINEIIGDSSMGTNATTVTGAIAEQGENIENIAKGINAVGYEKGGPVTIQTASNAANFVLDKPSGRMLVESTNAPIFTGTINNIDLLNIKEGVFTDSHSGVTIEVTGNEVYIHGTTTAGFRFDFQKGEFYTDSLSNHPADLDILPNVDDGYRLCFVAETGYTMPSNIYIGKLNDAGTSISAVPLNGSTGDIYKNGTYIALYSNTAISNIDIKFRLGFKVANIPGTIAGIEATAKADYETTIIKSGGAYILGDLTWTGDETQYEAYQLLKENNLTNSKSFVWFGDSISQLRELPNLTSALIGATVYDCSFAGAPLTYGDPTRYQPTGFMSLCGQIVSGDFSSLASALDAQEQSGVNVTEKRQHLATLQTLDFNEVTDIVVLAGTNDFDNDYVNSTNFVSGFSNAITNLLTAFPHLIIHVLSPIWRGDKSEGVATIPTMEDIVNFEKSVAEDYCLPFTDLYHTSGINRLTASVYLESDVLHLSAKGDAMLANRCAKALLSE